MYYVFEEKKINTTFTTHQSLNCLYFYYDKKTRERSSENCEKKTRISFVPFVWEN